MKRIFYLILVVIPMACNQSHHGDSSFKKAPVQLPKAGNITPLLREGDIILRQGQGPFSSEIVRVMNEKNPVSHCGIIIKHQQQLVVVQSISEELSGIDGIQLQDIQSFINDTADSNLFVMRFTDTAISNSVAKEAVFLLDKKIAFDHEYNLKNNKKMYCAELPYYCFKKTGNTGFFKYIKTNGKRLLRFDSFFQSAWFTKVYACRSINWVK